MPDDDITGRGNPWEYDAGPDWVHDLEPEPLTRREADAVVRAPG